MKITCRRTQCYKSNENRIASKILCVYTFLWVITCLLPLQILHPFQQEAPKYCSNVRLLDLYRYFWYCITRYGSTWGKKAVRDDLRTSWYEPWLSGHPSLSSYFEIIREGWESGILFLTQACSTTHWKFQKRLKKIYFRVANSSSVVTLIRIISCCIRRSSFMNDCLIIDCPSTLGVIIRVSSR